MLHRLVQGKVIKSVWTDYKSTYHKGNENIKDPKYFQKFVKAVSGKKIIGVRRRAKNVLIDIEGESTILIHMKMTGQLLYGVYKKILIPNIEILSKSKKLNSKSEKWIPRDSKSLLNDPLSRFIHLVFTLSDGKHLAFSDMRKFGTVMLIPDKEALSKKFEKIGPEPLEKAFDWRALRARLSRFPNGKTKTVLMNPEVIAGIGNIYSDEILWLSGIHPERKTKDLKEGEIKTILLATKKLLKKGIAFGGDSMSDYRNPLGEKGNFQNHHNAYRFTGKRCLKKDCGGKIARKIVGGRSAHFCDRHQV